MPSNNSYPVLITDWQELLQAADTIPGLQPSFETERQALVQALADVQTLRGRQQELVALKQRATQDLQAATLRGKEAAIQVRSVVRGKMGPKNELLVQFKVAPNRKRPRKAKEVVKKPDGENPGTDQGTPASPPDKPAV